MAVQGLPVRSSGKGNNATRDPGKRAGANNVCHQCVNPISGSQLLNEPKQKQVEYYLGADPGRIWGAQQITMCACF